MGGSISARRALAPVHSWPVLDHEAPMTSRHNPVSTPDLTAEEWGLILAALDGYQHHAVYRALHEKIAPLAKAKGIPLLVATAPPVPERDRKGRSRPDLAG